jgi:hypothetical protein
MNPNKASRDEEANPNLWTGAPTGAITGTAVGLAGKGVAVAVDPTREDAYWRDHYSDRPYVERGSSYNDYGPAYGLGVDAFTRNPGRTFDEVEPEMSGEWTTSHSASSLNWERARHAARDAWNRISPPN